MRKTHLNILAATFCTIVSALLVNQARASDPAAAASATESSEESAPAARPEQNAESQITRDMRGRADMDGNGEFTVMDLALMLGYWGNCPLRATDPCPGDINGDFMVDEADLSIMLTLIGLKEIPVIDFPNRVQ